MPSPLLVPLLALQDHDIRRVALETQLKAVPNDIALVERDIGNDKAAIDAARSELRELETRKKLLETEIGSAEQTLAKYRTQQLAVKKNDEYQALGHEIDTVQGQIGESEARELEIMYAIDEAKKKFAAAEAALKRNISGHEARIRMLRERETGLVAELETAQSQVAAARSVVATQLLRSYDRIAPRGLPAVVPIRGGKCGGCHLKVSSAIESAARGRDIDGQWPACEQCSRLVYWEA